MYRIKKNKKKHSHKIMIRGWRRREKENRVNRSGSGEPAGSRTPLKGKKGVRFFIIPFSSSL